MAIGGTNAQALRQQAATAAETVAAEDVSPAQSPEVTRVFEAVASEGFIVIDGDSADDGPIEFGGDDIEGDVEIEGLVYSDDTWESTRIDFPNLDPATLLESADVDLPIEPGQIEGEIQVIVDPIDGTYDADEGLMTADPIALTIDVDVSALGAVDIDLEVDAEAFLTTHQSGDMEGSATNLDGSDGSSASATLVGNEFALDATGEVVDPPLVDPIDIDEELGLPSPEGRNYLQLVLDMEVTDVDQAPDEPVPLTSFVTEESTGFISFNTEDPTQRRFEFGEDLEGENIEIEGTIYDDGHWESTRVSIPPIDLEEEIAEAAANAAPSWAPTDMVTNNLEYTTDLTVEPIEGEYRPHEGLFTGTLNVTINQTAGISICDPTGILGCWEPNLIDVTVEPDPAELTTHESDGSATEDGMQGGADGLDTSSPQVNLVGQEFGVPSAGGSGTIRDFIVNSVFGTPSNSGMNWIDLDLTLDLEEQAALDGELVFDPIVGDSPPLDLNRDGLYENVIGDQSFTDADVNELANNLKGSAVQGQTELFTFAGGLNRERVGIVDVQALYNAGEGHWDPDNTPDPPAVIQPEGEVSLSLDTPEVIEAGDVVDVDVVVSGATDGIEAFDFEISLPDSDAVEILDFDHADDVEFDESQITDDGQRAVFEGALEGSPYDGAETLTLATLELEALQPGTTTNLDFDVGSFPRGLFWADTGQTDATQAETTQYEVAQSSGETLSVDYTADVTIETQEAPGGQTVTISVADPGDNGGAVGIWSMAGDSPDVLHGTVSCSEVSEDVGVTLDQPLTEAQPVMAAVHPADSGDASPDVETVLASDTAQINVSPPSITGGNAPQDNDDDGLYEDINGDNTVDIFDVQALFENMNDPAVQDFAPFFNFSGQNEDEVEIYDVQALFNKLDE